MEKVSSYNLKISTQSRMICRLMAYKILKMVKILYLRQQLAFKKSKDSIKRKRYNNNK